jgi:hypothetical protein
MRCKLRHTQQYLEILLALGQPLWGSTAFFVSVVPPASSP